MAYQEDVNVNLNVLTGTLGGVTAILGGMSALTSSFGAMATQASESFGALDGLLVTSTALIATFGIQAAESFGEFEQGMKIVQTVSNQTGYAINELSDKASQMSVAYRTSIGDITDGLQTLGRAGLNSVGSQLEVLESGLQTAKLEGRNLNSVLEELIQNTSMLGGNLKSVDFGQQSEYLNSLMVGTSMTAPIDSHDISQTLQYAGGTAAAAGANLENKDKLEDLMGTVAAFAQKGVTGSMAGTALRAFFTKPASQDKNVTEGLEMIGLTPDRLWEKGGNEMKSVSDQIGIIQRQMDHLNMSTMDQVEIWGKIVGPKMGQQMMKLESSDIKELTRDIQSAKSAQELSAQTLYTYNQRLSELSQLKDQAFRGFGEKLVTFLNPALSVINYIMKWMSNPIVNTSAFMLIGSLLGHGLRKAWGMATTLYNEIKNLISGVISGINDINTIAGGSASGFQQSASQVDFLNRKLQETDATLQAIQAKSMGIRPGYQLPGGLYTDQVNKRTFNAYEEDVVIDKHGVMGDNIAGKIYSGEHGRELIKGIEEHNKQALESIEMMKTANAAEIEALKIKKQNAKAVVEESWRTRTQEIKSINRFWKETGLDPISQAQLQNDSEYKSLKKSFGKHIPKESLEQLYGYYRYESNERDMDRKKWVQSQMGMAASQRRTDLGEYTRGFDEQIAALSDEEAIKAQFPMFDDKQIAEIKEKGITKVRTELKMFDEYEYNEWQKRQRERGAEGIYSLERASDFYDAEGNVNYESTVGKQHGSELSDLKKRGYYVVPESHFLPESQPNAQLLGQALNKNILNEMADARDNIVDHQKKELLGQTGINSKAHRIGSESLNSFSKGLNTATSAATNFSKKITQAPSKMKEGFLALQERRSRGKGYFQDAENIKSFQQKSYNLMQNKDFVKMNKGEDLKTITANLRKELNMTAAEFSALVNTEQQFNEVFNFTGQQLQEVGERAAFLREEIASLTISEEEEAAMSGEVVAAKKSEAMASVQAAAADEAESISSASNALSSAFSVLGNGMKSVVGYMGGPLMAGMMGITVVMQAIQASQQAWQEKMQEATNELSESIDQLSEYEDKIKETFGKENELSEANSEKALAEQYANVYDTFYQGQSNRADLGRSSYEEDVSMVGKRNEDGSYNRENMLTPEQMEEINNNIGEVGVAQDENVQALKENTMQLVAATAAYNQAQEKLADSFDDGTWGFDSAASDFTDQLGEWQEEIWNLGAFMTSGDAREGFLDKKSPILTGSQADSNYGGSTEFAPILMADSFRFGTDQGLRQFFGSDFNRIVGLMDNINSNVMGIHSQNFSAYQVGQNPNGVSHEQMALMQISMKERKEDYQVLGKQMFRYEQQNGFPGSNSLARGVRGGRARGTAYQDIGNLMAADKALQTGNKKEYDRAMKALNGKTKLTVQDKNLINSVKKLMALTDNKLSEQNIIAMGQLQQMQDMYQVANETVAPGIMQTVQGVYQNVSATGTAGANAGTAAGGAVSAGANAAAIASILGAQAQSNAEGYAYDKWKRTGETMIDGMQIKNQDDFIKALAKQGPQAKKWESEVLQTLSGSGWSVNHPGATPEEIKKQGERLAGENSDLMKSGASYQDKLNTATKMLTGYMTGAILASYDQSSLGEYGSGSHDVGSGSGGDGGSGESDKDKDSGSKKERVDLVLCNKKEIPKLNVNLFKKPPNFTVLNKNFKLRDIKINSEDKPKAILNAIKNGIIETQKRMDPKIIQDESAEYDPVSATDGSSTPSGTTKTTT